MSQQPNFSIFDEALAVALRAARAGPATDTEGQPTANALSMGDFLHTSAAVKDNAPFYRSYEAAADWLESDTNAFTKGEDGVTFADRPTAVASLRKQQEKEDRKAGPVDGAPAATPIFAGVVR